MTNYEEISLIVNRILIFSGSCVAAVAKLGDEKVGYRFEVRVGSHSIYHAGKSEDDAKRVADSYNSAMKPLFDDENNRAREAIIACVQP